MVSGLEGEPGQIPNKVSQILPQQPQETIGLREWHENPAGVAQTQSRCQARCMVAPIEGGVPALVKARASFADTTRPYRYLVAR